MKIVILDTETDSLPLWHEPSDHPKQPHMLQLAAVKIDLGGGAQFPSRTETRFQSFVRPEGWMVDERMTGDDGKPTAFSVNKISNEFLNENGRPLAEVMDQFDAEFLDGTEEIYAYGAGFDRRILRIAAFRRWGRDGHPRKGAPMPAWYCILQTLKPMVNMAPTQKMIDAGFGSKPKPPKLLEAYEWAFGKPFEGAHDAIADLGATVALWDFVRDKGVLFHRLQDRE